MLAQVLNCYWVWKPCAVRQATTQLRMRMACAPDKLPTSPRPTSPCPCSAGHWHKGLRRVRLPVGPGHGPVWWVRAHGGRSVRHSDCCLLSFQDRCIGVVEPQCAVVHWCTQPRRATILPHARGDGAQTSFLAGAAATFLGCRSCPSAYVIHPACPCVPWALSPASLRPPQASRPAFGRSTTFSTTAR